VVSPLLPSLAQQFLSPSLVPWLARLVAEEVIALPFALLSAALLFRSWKGALAVALHLVVWEAAYVLASPTMHGVLLWFVPSGLVGGLGVALADSICLPRLRSLKHLGGAAVVGSIAAVPFYFLLDLPLGKLIGNPLLAVACGFAIWQAAVGTYLYMGCFIGQEG
jgi:hypothetical protein